MVLAELNHRSRKDIQTGVSDDLIVVADHGLEWVVSQLKGREELKESQIPFVDTKSVGRNVMTLVINAVDDR